MATTTALRALSLYLIVGICAYAAVPLNPAWMKSDKAFLDNMILSDLTLPGTHDTGTYMLTERLEEGIAPKWILDVYTALIDLHIAAPYDVIKKWSHTQSYDVYDQLQRGIRFLDVRVCWDDKTSEFRTLHGLLGDTTINMLKNITQFMDENTEEVLVLQFGNFAQFTPDLYTKAIELIKAEIGPLLWLSDTGSPYGFGTYKEMVSSNKRIVAFFDACDYINGDPYFFCSQLLPNRWANNDNFTTMEGIVSDSVVADTGYPNEIYKLQWVLTENAGLIIESVFDLGKYDSLRELSRVANSNLNKFMERYSAYSINLIMTDFFQETDSVERSRILNRRMCNDNPKYRAPLDDTKNCRYWVSKNLCSTNKTIATLCPRSCGLCKINPGEPGSACTKNDTCYYKKCQTSKQICLVEFPRNDGDPCGSAYQCKSGICSSFTCGNGKTVSETPSWVVKNPTKEQQTKLKYYLNKFSVKSH